MDQREKILKLLNQVHDPEIPVLTIKDLGIVREVLEKEDGKIKWSLPPPIPAALP